MKKLLLFCVLIGLFSCQKDNEEGFINQCLTIETTHFDKIKGGSILQTWLLSSISQAALQTIDLAEKTNAQWVALSPIIGIDEINSQVYPYKYRFRASDEVTKMKVILPKMSNSGLHNVMLKPLTVFWTVNDSNFWGDFYVTTEEEWLEIERAYMELYYELAKLSEEFPQVKLLSIGNELKEFTKKRPQFFRELIATLKRDFPHLKLTYAANWDEYDTVSFWGEDLDYIGINPYFPLLNKRNPSLKEIKTALMPIKNKLNELSCTYNKPILFTEYGFRSIDYGLWESWRKEFYYDKAVNFELQNNAYTAFYATFWKEDWVAGGFFWEWRVILFGEENNPKENGWYVNDKPVEEIIAAQYAN